VKQVPACMHDILQHTARVRFADVCVGRSLSVWRFRMGATFPPRLVLGVRDKRRWKRWERRHRTLRQYCPREACFQRGRDQYGRVYSKMGLKVNESGAIRYRWSHAFTAPFSHVGMAWMSAINTIDFPPFKPFDLSPRNHV
jgi:hypothetical protein